MVRGQTVASVNPGVCAWHLCRRGGAAFATNRREGALRARSGYAHTRDALFFDCSGKGEVVCSNAFKTNAKVSTFMSILIDGNRETFCNKRVFWEIRVP